MAILIDQDTTFIVQGITGREAVSLTRENLDYGSLSHLGPMGGQCGLAWRAGVAGNRKGAAHKSAPHLRLG